MNDSKRECGPSWVVHHGAVPGALDALEAESVHAVVCDPPYELGFMGRSWDSSGVAFRSETWAACLRVLKPGGHLLAFGGSRTSHRIACAIEDAGFELRDVIVWLYASGFPKSLNVSKAIDKANGEQRPVVGVRSDGCGNTEASIHKNEGFAASRSPVYAVTSAASAASAAWDGWGTALKPAYEPIIVARKPLGSTVAACVLKHGTGAINVDACRIPFLDEDDQAAAAAAAQRSCRDQNANRTAYQDFNNGEASLAPYLAGMDRGRWPANVLHDDSADLRLHLGDARRFYFSPKASTADREEGTDELELKPRRTVNGGGGLEDDPKWATRERRNTHVTVKPSGLMEWLVRLVTPPVVSACPNCERRTIYGPASSSDASTVREVQCDVQAERQPAPPPVLQPGVRGGSDGEALPEDVSDVPEELQAEAPRQATADLLQPGVRSSGLRAGEAETGRPCGPEGLHPNPGAGSPDGEPGGIRDAAPARDGGAPRAQPDGRRGRSSSKRGKGGQPDREPRAADQGRSRPNPEAAAEADRVPPLRRDDPPVGTCATCGEALVRSAGIVLDPFTGSGTTGVAALRQGFRFVGVEMVEEHVKIARARIGWAALHPLERAAKSAEDDGQASLFGKPATEGVRCTRRSTRR